MGRAMTRQEIILRAYAKKISWIEAAEILGISCRHLRRIREKYEEVGYDGQNGCPGGKDESEADSGGDGRACAGIISRCVF